MNNEIAYKLQEIPTSWVFTRTGGCSNEEFVKFGMTVRLWCRQNLGNYKVEWIEGNLGVTDGLRFYILDEIDIMAFKLRWQ